LLIVAKSRLALPPEEANLRVERFAAKVPELKFSPAEMQSFLLVNKQSPSLAVANVDQWVSGSVDRWIGGLVDQWIGGSADHSWSISESTLSQVRFRDEMVHYGRPHCSYRRHYR